MSDSVSRQLEVLAEFVEQLSVPARPLPLLDEKQRWAEIDRQIAGMLTNRRGLIVGGDVVGDAEAFATRGAEYVLGCVCLGDGESAEESEVISRPGIDVQPLAWRELDPRRHGHFELVLCSGLVHRVTEPMALLRALRSMMTEGATLLISSMMLDDPERSEYLRFVPDRYAGDQSWWFIPGRLAIRWMLQVAGFVVEAEFGDREGPRDLVPVLDGYLRATAV